MAHREVETLSRLLLDHIRAGERITSFLITQQVRAEGSTASKHIATRGAIPEVDIRRSHQDMIVSAMAGLEHLRAFAASAPTGPIGGWALGSLARGSAEAFGRCWYLIAAPSVTEMYYRYMRMRIQSASYLVGEEYRDFEPSWGDNAGNLMQTWENELVALGGAKVSKRNTPRPPALAKQLLAEDFDVRAGSWYSSMAAMSHAERTATDRMADHSIHGTHELVMNTNGLTYDLEQFLFQPMGAEAKVVRGLIDYFDVPQSVGTSWVDTGLLAMTYGNSVWHAS